MKLDINRASVEELTQIKHIGPVFAEMIVDKRPYRDIYELSKVLGLGEKRMNDIFEQDIIFAGRIHRPRKSEPKEIKKGNKIANSLAQVWGAGK